MYAAHFKLTGRPFQLSPDPRFFFGSRSHRKAMAYLTYGLSEREGFIVITGDIGAGKTTLVRHLLAELDKDKYVSANVVTTHLEADDALRMVASAFRLPVEGADKATLLRAIETFLIENFRRGKHVLLIVDEVQNMPISALEELRMLSNFQLDNRSLLQCFLLGQPQFRRIMAYEDMEQLRQRVIASCHLEPMDEDETREYIEHRLRRVSWAGDPAFSDGAFRLIYVNTNGVPRRINNLCSRLLLYSYLEGLHEIDERVVTDVVQELAEEGRKLMPEEGHGMPDHEAWARGRVRYPDAPPPAQQQPVVWPPYPQADAAGAPGGHYAPYNAPPTRPTPPAASDRAPARRPAPPPPRPVPPVAEPTVRLAASNGGPSYAESLDELARRVALLKRAR